MATTSGIRYRPSRKGTGQILRSPGVRALVEEKAEEAKAYAISISPDAPPYGEGYIASFVVERSKIRKVRRAQRVTARLINTSPHAAIVEWVNGNRILGRTAAYIGDGDAEGEYV